MTTCALAWVVVLLLLPVVILLWATESRQQRAKRLRQQGWTQQRIANHLKVSRTTIQRDLKTA